MERIRPVPDHLESRQGYGYGYGYGGQMQLPPAEEEGRDIDVRGILYKLWRGKWIILICMMFGGIFGALTTTQQPVRYWASAKVMFDIPRANVDAGEAVVSSTLDRGPLQNQIEVLRSTALIQRVIDDLKLSEKAAFNPALRPPPGPTWRDRVAIPPEVIDLMIASGLRSPPGPPAAPPDPVREAEKLNRNIVERLRGGIQLRPIESSQVLEIGYVAGNAQLTADIVNSVAEQYIVDQMEGKLETFRAATAWLSDRVEQLQERVEVNEAAVLEAQAKLALQAGTSLEGVREQLSALTAARVAARTEASTLQAQYTRFSGALESGAAIAQLPEFRDNPAIAPLLVRRAEILASDDQLADTLRPSHPSRARLVEDLERVDQEIKTEAQEVLEALNFQRDAALDSDAQLETDIRALEAQELELSTNSVEIRNLEREAQASRILYENLLSRLQETNAQEDLQTADVRILTPALPPLGPITTAQSRTMTTSLVLGAVIGVGLIFLLERLNNTFRSPQQLEQMIGMPVLATIPRAGNRMNRADVVRTLREKPNSSLAEAIRNLRTSILFSHIDDPPKVVMFSSSVPREGKSTTAMLTALTSRQMGKSAIIVDCDLRLPALSKVLQVGDDRPGLLSVIDETATVEEAIYVEPETGLHVLMTQASERVANINAADVLASTRFRELVKTLSASYDLVVLDTPPTLVVADARIVSGLADASVYCVRWDNTPREAVKEGLRELTSVNADISGVVLTMVNEARAARYAYDGYNYYKGRYRDYYETS